MKGTIIQSTVTPTIKIVVEREGAESATWTLCLDYRALAKIEEHTGLDLKNPGNWHSIKSGTTFPTIVWCCLGRYSPDVTLEAVQDSLNPQAHALLWDALFNITFPGLAEAWKKELEERKANESPNETPDRETT